MKVLPVIALLAMLQPANATAEKAAFPLAGFTVTITVGLKIEPAATPAPPAPAAQKKAVRAAPRKTTTPRTAPKPVTYSLAGTWDWVAVCPVVGHVTGATTFQAAGSGQYTGALRTSLNQKARVKGTRTGRDFILTERYGLIKVTGQHRLSANGRSFSGRVNNGCTVSGKKR